MFGRRDFVTAALVIYLVLIILFFAYKEPNLYSACIDGHSCVRFCCDDPATCSNKFINERFDDNLVLKNFIEPKKHEVKYIFGRPECSTLKSFEADRQWEFRFDGAVVVKQNSTRSFIFYNSNEYCLEPKNNTDNDSIDWDLKYCEANTNETVHVIVGSASVVVTFAAIVVYIMSNSLRTAAGRCELMLLIGLFLLQLGYTWKDSVAIGITHGILSLSNVGGLLLTYFWICVLTFDIWRSFRYQEATEDEMKKFRLYCYFVFGAIATLLVACILHDLSQVDFRYFMRYSIQAILACFLIMAVVDIILLLQTSYMVFQLSKATRSTDHSWFEAEKERFWKYLGIYLVMLIIWPFEIYSMNFGTSLGSHIIMDIIKLFSTAVIFVAFAWKNFVELLKD